MSQATAARALRMSQPTFIHQLRPKLPPAAVRQIGRRVLVHLPELIDAVVLRERAKGVGVEDALLAGGGDSPALEKYRAMRAGQEEIKLQRLRQQLVFVDEVRTGLHQIAGAVRRGVERLQRVFGNDAAEMVLDPLIEFERNWEQVLGGPNSNPVTGESAGVDGTGGAAAAVGGADAEAAATEDDRGVRGAGDRAAHRPAQGEPVQVRKKPLRRSAAAAVRKRSVAKTICDWSEPER